MSHQQAYNTAYAACKQANDELEEWTLRLANARVMHEKSAKSMGPNHQKLQKMSAAIQQLEKKVLEKKNALQTKQEEKQKAMAELVRSQQDSSDRPSKRQRTNPAAHKRNNRYSIQGPETDQFVLGGWDISNYKDYKKLEKLGEGTYGVVCKVKHEPSGTILAFKKVKLDLEEEGIPATTIREVSLLKSLRHKYIVRMYECLQYNSNLYLVFEFVSMDLQKYLQVNNPLDQATIKRLALQMLLGLDFCHCHGVLHRDLKPQNLLVSERGELKIADFGLGRDHGIPMETITHEVVTLWYRCPEILLGSKEYSVGVDVWAVGCILVELHSGRACFRGDSEIDQLFQIFQVTGTPTESEWPSIQKLKDYSPRFPRWKPQDLGPLVKDATVAALDLIRRCLCLIPAKRIMTYQAIEHPWFDGVDSDIESVRLGKWAPLKQGETFPAAVYPL